MRPSLRQFLGSAERRSKCKLETDSHSGDFGLGKGSLEALLTNKFSSIQAGFYTGSLARVYSNSVYRCLFGPASVALHGIKTSLPKQWVEWIQATEKTHQFGNFGFSPAAQTPRTELPRVVSVYYGQCGSVIHVLTLALII